MNNSGFPLPMKNCCPLQWGYGQGIWKPPNWWTSVHTLWTSSMWPHGIILLPSRVVFSLLPCHADLCWGCRHSRLLIETSCHSRFILDRGGFPPPLWPRCSTLRSVWSAPYSPSESSLISDTPLPGTSAALTPTGWNTICLRFLFREGGRGGGGVSHWAPRYEHIFKVYTDCCFH